MDGYDVVVNNEPGTLESAFLASGKRVLISSELRLGCCVNKQASEAHSSTRRATVFRNIHLNQREKPAGG